jgi:hypothetical protein
MTVGLVLAAVRSSLAEEGGEDEVEVAAEAGEAGVARLRQTTAGAVS